MYTNYRSPYSNDPYADDENGDADQMPDQSQGADPQDDAAGEGQQDELTQNKTNSVDELMHYLAMNIPVGEGIISRPSGADLLALANNSDSDYPSSLDSGYDAPDAGPTAEQTPEPAEASEPRAINPAMQKEIDQVKGASSASLKDRYAAYLLATRNQDEINHMQSAGIPDDELQTDVSTPEFAAFNRRLDAGNVNVSGLYDKAKKIADRMNAPPDPREFTDARNEAAQRRTPEEAQAFKEELAAATARHFFDLLKPETSKDTDVNDKRVDSKDEPDTEELDSRNTQKLHDDISSIVQKIDQLSSDKKEESSPLPSIELNKLAKIKSPSSNGDGFKIIDGYRSYFDAAVKKTGVDGASLRAMAKTESGGEKNPATARSGESAVAPSGVMQIYGPTWTGTVKNHKELSQYKDFAKYRSDPEVNILVGAYAFQDIRKLINIPSSDPNFEKLSFAAYNGGPSTINYAYENAKADHQSDPGSAVLDPKYLEPAIKKSEIYKYYTEGSGQKFNPYLPGKPGGSKEKAEQWAIKTKFKEVSEYAQKVFGYREKEE
ncbi:transglycosylase SLT domain-containing protein [Undibacterium sp. Ji50W]|uniref:transglycosylase SLT domain-containing protein n=1 Tax=Undibacterium sp. Ji50W TaxID=3413041 RepID=UPI003BF15A28